MHMIPIGRIATPCHLPRILLRILSPFLLALMAASCATVEVSRPAAPTGPGHPTMAAAAELARNDASLAGQARAANVRQIERLLAGLDDATLSRETAALPPADPLYNFAGRALLNRGLPLPRPFERGGNWRFDAGNRPPAEADGYRPPLKLAGLLPQTGTMATAAAPVRDGLLAGYYGETRRRPDIMFHDTHGTASGAIAAYGMAVAAGADFVLGPLGREEVSALFGQPLSVPVLALNRGTVPPPAGSASFSLAPEDDGIAAAEFLLDRNARRVLVLSGATTACGVPPARSENSLQSRGGAVVNTLTVVGDQPDLSAALSAAAQAEGGIDAVFLALRASQARAIAPQLSMAGLAGKPRVATSQLGSGTGKAEDNRMLDGIAFPTEAWGVRGVSGLPSAASAAEMLPSARGPAAKLFAFGYDAWLLTAYLERLATSAGDVRGATGTLSIDGFGNVVRAPAWSTFSGGHVVPLADDGR